MHGYRALATLGKFRAVIGDRIGQVDLALFGQHMNQQRCDRLGRREVADGRIRGHRRLQNAFTVVRAIAGGVAESPMQYLLAPVP